MKKRIIAAICALAIVLSVCVAVLTVDVSAATKTYQVGFSRVDINPWEDPYDTNGDGSRGGMLQLPLRGNGNTMNRQSVPELVDDNGDGEVKTDGSDGLFASCIAVTDDDGDTVLMYSVAIVGGFDVMVGDARQGLINAIKERGIDVDLPAENIMIQGTHTHNSIDVTMYKESFKDNTKTYNLQDQNGKETEATITCAEVYNNFTVWYPYMINQLVEAGVQAIQDRATATMSKGEIDAGDASGKVMNTVRHYTRVLSSGNELYVRGSNFNSGNLTYKDEGDGSATVVAGSAELAEANDTMYCLKFDFGGAKDPIALVNWRAHTTQNDRDGTRLNISSCYVNRMSYELSKRENGGYRSIFIQGAAGNINPSSALYGQWCGTDTHKDANGDGIWIGNELSGNIYGEVLGQVAAKCLNENMSVVDAGDIKVTNTIFHAGAKSYAGNDMAIHAAKVISNYGVSKVSYPFVYPVEVTEKIYNSMDDTEKAYFREVTGYKESNFLFWYTWGWGYYSGETYAFASRFHVNDVTANAKESGKQDVDLSAFMLGDHVAFVTAPGEMYDRYNSNINWDDLKNKTQKEIYDILSAVNEWDKILSSAVGGSYGTPFVMGYANSHIGYMPNYISYEYGTGSKNVAVGAYEAHTTELNQGENEHILDVFAGMLKSMVSGEELTQEDMYHTDYCQVCKTNAVWKPISETYNNTSGNPGLQGGHYYLQGDTNTEQKKVAAGQTVCLDLNGHTLTGRTRAFYLDQTDAILNIMDSSQAKTGKVQGHGGTNKTGTTPWGGGSVYVSADNTCNLYSGTLTQAFTDTSGVAYGGVVELRYNTAVFNMYGGEISGGMVTWTGLKDGTSAVALYGGNVYVYGGEFNMYDGVIKDGIVEAQVVEHVNESGTVTLKKNTAYGGNISVREGSFNLYGGTIQNGEVIKAEKDGTIAYGYGGNVYVTSGAYFNLLGGNVIGGTASTKGPCIYLAEIAYTTLSGNGSADQIYINGSRTDNVTVSGGYSGNVTIRNTTTLSTAGTVVGISDHAVINTTGLKAYSSNKPLVVSGDKIVIGATTTCHCGETVVMNQLTQALWDAFGGNLPGGHYQLAGNINAQVVDKTTGQVDPNGAVFTGNVCLDLAGKEISVTTGRLYNIADGASLKIYDTSAAKSGKIITAGLPSTVNSTYGGLFQVQAGGRLELHGGTLTMVLAEGRSVSRGGLVDLSGTFDMTGGALTNGICNKTNTSCYGGNVAIQGGGVMNMSGGSITGGTAYCGNDAKEGTGGNVQVFANGTLNMSGGTIDMGTCEGAQYGPCIRMSGSSKVVLSGDASPAEVSYRAGLLDISGTYTGTTLLRQASGTAGDGTVVGAALNNANISGATITFYNDPQLYLTVEGTQLVVKKQAGGGANILDDQDNVLQTNVAVQDAVNMCQGTNKVLVLTENMNQSGIVVSQDLTIDLNGMKMNQPISVSGGAKLICMDSQTEDYDVSDEVFTKLPAAMAESAVAADGYVKHIHEDGTASFHKLDTEIDYVNFKPEKAGIYYSSLFKGDVYAAMEVDTFGVALSITGAPLSKDGIASHAQYSVFDGSLFQPGQEEEFASTILVDILDEKYGTVQNRKNGDTIVYGNSYIKLKNGEYIYDSVKGVTLRQVVEYVNDNWDDYKANQEDVLALFDRFPAVFRVWNTNVIEEAYEASK